MPVVNTFSGCPAGAPGDSGINWITCPWPTEFSDMLRYQWEDVAIPYWREASKVAEQHGIKVALEMHPGMLVYNVYTMLRLREATGPMIGANFDPSHLFWNGVDPVAAIRKLGPAIHHVHGKDVYVDPINNAVNGCIDNKPYDRHPGAFVDLPHHRLRARCEGVEGHHQRAAADRLRLCHLHRARGWPDVE